MRKLRTKIFQEMISSTLEKTTGCEKNEKLGILNVFLFKLLLMS